MNSALVMKIGWSLLTKPHALWVRLLLAKYKLNPTVMTTKYVFSKGLALLRAISMVWSFVHSGVRLSVGDEVTVRFWWDIWTHNTQPLLYEVLGPIPDHQLDWTVRDYIDESGQWKWELCSHLVSAGTLIRIAAFPPPSRLAGPDTMYWDFLENGCFTTKSAYLSLVHT
ncbi:Unknown protein [Striga hermonthica]|uniref:Reverse transcriptase zinc-binding domain-containing protein n=1 Tax=Striga hermonthica TaxID=68872 RepID=A0A9N7R8Y8_STRHE|nr:Unknown protein [Striga hermonthica]